MLCVGIKKVEICFLKLRLLLKILVRFRKGELRCQSAREVFRFAICSGFTPSGSRTGTDITVEDGEEKSVEARYQ